MNASRLERPGSQGQTNSRGVIDPQTGEVRTAQLFVAALGASSYTFAEATWTQFLPDWIASHARAFGFFRGCDDADHDLKVGVTKTCFYDPAINRTYADLAAHYDTKRCPSLFRPEAERCATVSRSTPPFLPYLNRSKVQRDDVASLCSACDVACRKGRKGL